MIKRLSACLVFLGFLFSASAVFAEKTDEGTTRFLFIGHIRGHDNFKVNPLVPHFVRDAKNVKKDLCSSQAIRSVVTGRLTTRIS